MNLCVAEDALEHGMAARQSCFCHCISTVFRWICNFVCWLFCCRSSAQTKRQNGYQPIKIISLGGYRSQFFHFGDQDEEATFLVRTFSTRSTRSEPTVANDEKGNNFTDCIDFVNLYRRVRKGFQFKTNSFAKGLFHSN